MSSGQYQQLIDASNLTCRHCNWSGDTEAIYDPEDSPTELAWVCGNGHHNTEER